MCLTGHDTLPCFIDASQTISQRLCCDRRSLYGPPSIVHHNERPEPTWRGAPIPSSPPTRPTASKSSYNNPWECARFESWRWSKSYTPLNDIAEQPFLPSPSLAFSWNARRCHERDFANGSQRDNELQRGVQSTAMGPREH